MLELYDTDRTGGDAAANGPLQAAGRPVAALLAAWGDAPSGRLSYSGGSPTFDVYPTATAQTDILGARRRRPRPQAARSAAA